MKTVTSLLLASAVLAFAGAAQAAGVSEREYKRGYNDCLRGEYDTEQHGSSYKRGCRAAEESGKSAGNTVQDKADKTMMKIACRAALVGRFYPHTRSVNVQSSEHTNVGWTMYGAAVMDDGGRSDFACIFSSNGHLKRVNASDPQGASYDMDSESYCPPDVSEANRYMYPGCN
jgi:hypothetical protein